MKEVAILKEFNELKELEISSPRSFQGGRPLTSDLAINREQVIDIDAMANSIYIQLSERCERGLTATACPIYRVHDNIREVDNYSYEPWILSIGPYHHGKPALKSMESEKLEALQQVLSFNKEKDVKHYLDALMPLKDLVRSYYPDEFDLDSQSFLKMILLDACCLIMIMGGLSTENFSNEDQSSPNTVHDRHNVGNASDNYADEMNEERGTEKTGREMSNVNTKEESEQNGRMENEHDRQEPHNFSQDVQIMPPVFELGFILHDIFLVENQIPFFVIKRVYDIVTDHGSIEVKPIARKITDLLEQIPFIRRAASVNAKPTNFLHLLHLLHMYYKPSKHQKNNDSDITKPLIRMPRATELYETGVEFRKIEIVQDKPLSLLDISFSNGVMEIPCFSIDDSTRFVFRNLIYFEQSCPSFGSYVTAYTTFMSELLSTPADAKLLVQTGIIEHHLGSDSEVSNLFNSLTQRISFSSSEDYFKNLRFQLKEHYQSRVNRLMAWLKHKHFDNPWLASSVIAAIIILFCTLVQTVYSVLSYYN